MAAIFTRVVCTSVPTFQNLAKQNKVQARIVIATGGTVGLAEWIIDDTHVLYEHKLNIHCYLNLKLSFHSQVFHFTLLVIYIDLQDPAE